MVMLQQEIRIQVENLFSWSEFYSKNHIWEKHTVCENQIQEFKTKHNIF